ncbi:class I SAM-dependent methyltransferase [Desulfopila sp. IMCC35008]|uniref:class I SAM-dependent methyltransferase n=1 Tax=Desulfopila sp. IMCC35008 TaxID=2653858 RepID=UPI0013D3B03E|nr:class I SAM-dependent methyltransferase [Desulfopila sp. IMCC35008]
MNILQQRLSKLSPRQRQVLEAALRKAGQQVPTELADVSSAAEPAQDVISKAQLLQDKVPAAIEVKEKTQQFYTTISRQLNSSLYRQHARFLNIGFLDDGSPTERVVELPERVINRACVNLVLEMVGGSPLEGVELLDVGCGRGGTIDTLANLFQPERLTGIDLCREAITFCRDNAPADQAHFLVGDAEHLPFPNRSFDCLTNLESSHNYPEIDSFYREVARVLRPGGRFLYSDILPREKKSRSTAFLRDLGLQLMLDRDITANVLLSCRATGDVHLGAFPQANDQEMMSDFLGLEGSRAFCDMEKGIDIYFIQHWEKVHGR